MSKLNYRNEVIVHPEMVDTTISTGSTAIHISYSMEIPYPAESCLSAVLKEELDEDGEDLALPSPGTLNNMMSKIQS